MKNRLRNLLPRRSVLKALIGAGIIFSTLALAAYGFSSLGIFGIIPIIIGGLLMKEYFREIGFNS